MSLPTFPGIFAVSHDPAPPGLRAAGAGVGTLVSIAQIVDHSPFLQTLVIGIVNTVAAVVIGAVIKHLSGHARKAREEKTQRTKAKVESLIRQHDADSAEIDRLKTEVERLKADL